jgi:uncharacterized protein (DUF4415 family)
MTKKNSLEKLGTDIERIKNMKDEEIDYSDIPKTTPEMFKKPLLRKGFKPIPNKSQENFPIDRNIIEYFKSLEFNYPAKINQLLREYMESHPAK